MNGKNRRKLKNIFLVRPNQVKRIFYTSLFGLFLLFTIMFTGYRSLFNAIEQWSEKSGLDADLTQQLLAMITQQALYTMIFLLIYLLVMSFYIIIGEHKIYGPIVAIRRFIKEIEANNHPRKLKLREGDEFTELAEDLNNLAEHLQRKNQQT